MQAPSHQQVMTIVKKAEEVLRDPNLPNESLNFRLLNALRVLKSAPTTEGLRIIATDIITASEQEDGLDQLAEFCTQGLLLPSESPFDNSVGLTDMDG
jgi:hypothetical protein